jgi:hypothetical protein
MVRRSFDDDHEAATERAPYALPRGTPALQADPARTRRWLLLSFLGGTATATAAATALWLGTSRTHEPSEPRPDPMGQPPPEDPRLAWAREVASGSWDELLTHYPTFVLAVERSPYDPQLRIGLERLIEHAVFGTDDSSLRLARRLLRTATVQHVPPPLPDHLPRLRMKVDRADRERR